MQESTPRFVSCHQLCYWRVWTQGESIRAFLLLTECVGDEFMEQADAARVRQHG